MLARLRTLALSLLGRIGHHSITAGLAVDAHAIAKLLAMAGIMPELATWPDFQAAALQEGAFVRAPYPSEAARRKFDV